MNEKFDIEHFPTSEAAVRMMSRISPIYDRAYVGKWIFQVMGEELDDVRLRFIELKDQAFPETATWGLKYWEQRYGVRADENASIEDRRQAVLSKRNTHAPLNPARMAERIEGMTGGKATIQEDVAPYTQSVTVTDGEGADTDAVLAWIKRVKPSHITITLKMASKPVKTTVYAGAAFAGCSIVDSCMGGNYSG